MLFFAKGPRSFIRAETWWDQDVAVGPAWELLRQDSAWKFLLLEGARA